MRTMIDHINKDEDVHNIQNSFPALLALCNNIQLQ